jgi:hypothetical protein
VLAIVYNTTRAAPPPSSRHSGWSTRKLGDGGEADERDPKRRRIKEAVLALGKKERARLKSLGNGNGGIDSAAAGPKKGPLLREEERHFNSDDTTADRKPKVTSAGEVSQETSCDLIVDTHNSRCLCSIPTRAPEMATSAAV